MPSFLDRAIEYLSPEWGLKRTKARALSSFFRHYEAASTSRRTQYWQRPIGDANTVIGASLGRARDVVRDMVRNDPHAKRGVRTIANHTIGWGIVPKSKDAKATAVWKEWAETTACDADGRNDIYGLQKLIAKTVVEGGEAIVRQRIRRPEDGLPIPLQLQVLEGDYIDTNRTQEIQANGQTIGRIINGVEFDLLGRRRAYWMFREHPGAALFGGGWNSVRVPADGVLHIYEQERPGQVRGMTWLAPIVLTLKDFGEYMDAQLLKQKIAAYLAVVVTDAEGTGATLGVESEQDTDQPYTDRIKPGAVSYVAPGTDIRVVQPPRVQELDPYTRVQLRKIAAGFGVTYEDLTGDYSDVNFSSARMSRISHWDDVHDWRWQMMVPQFCIPAWRWAMQFGAIVGRIDPVASADGFPLALQNGQTTWLPSAEWTPPPMPMIEPDKEGLAYQRNIRSGLMSLSEALRERGYDPETVLNEMATDNGLLDKLGLLLDSDPRKMTQAGQAQSFG